MLALRYSSHTWTDVTCFLRTLFRYPPFQCLFAQMQIRLQCNSGSAGFMNYRLSGSFKLAMFSLIAAARLYCLICPAERKPIECLCNWRQFVFYHRALLTLLFYAFFLFYICKCGAKPVLIPGKRLHMNNKMRRNEYWSKCHKPKLRGCECTKQRSTEHEYMNEHIAHETTLQSTTHIQKDIQGCTCTPDKCDVYVGI